MIQWSSFRIVSHSSCCFKVWKSNSQCYFCTSWSLFVEWKYFPTTAFGTSGKVWGFVCLVLFYFRTSAFIFPATKGPIRLNHWSSILSFKSVQAELYSQSWTCKSGTFFSVYLFLCNHKSNHRSEKNPTLLLLHRQNSQNNKKVK